MQLRFQISDLRLSLALVGVEELIVQILVTHPPRLGSLLPFFEEIEQRVQPLHQTAVTEGENEKSSSDNEKNQIDHSRTSFQGLVMLVTLWVTSVGRALYMWYLYFTQDLPFWYCFFASARATLS